MDGERKKRKMENDEEDEGDEQKSVEKFFALIRSTKEARDRLLSHGDHAKKGAEEGKTEKEKEVGAWTPTFQLEDFMDGSHGKAVKNFPVIQAGPSQRKEEEEKQETKLGTGGSGLDLNLSL